MLRILACCVLASALLACGSRRQPAPPPIYAGRTYGVSPHQGGGVAPQPGMTPPGGGGAPPQLSQDPRTALNQIDEYLRRQGYARVGPAIRNENLPTNGVIAYGVEVQAHLCYTIVALAQPAA